MVGRKASPDTTEALQLVEARGFTVHQAAQVTGVSVDNLRAILTRRGIAFELGAPASGIRVPNDEIDAAREPARELVKAAGIGLWRRHVDAALDMLGRGLPRAAIIKRLKGLAK